jgi:hypothetical protein
MNIRGSASGSAALNPGLPGTPLYVDDQIIFPAARALPIRSSFSYGSSYRP